MDEKKDIEGKQL